MTITPEHRAEVRAWGIANRIPGAHPKGIVAQSVYDAYYAAGNPRPEVEVEASPETEELGEGDLWVQLNVPGMTQEHEEALCDAVLSLIQVAFDAGRHAGRLEMSLRFRAIAEEVES